MEIIVFRGVGSDNDLTIASFTLAQIKLLPVWSIEGQFEVFCSSDSMNLEETAHFTTGGKTWQQMIYAGRTLAQIYTEVDLL